MRRRDVLALLGGAAVPIPASWLYAPGQRPGARRVGVLSNSSPSARDDPRHRAFWQALNELGWFEGDNITIDYRWAGGNEVDLRALAAELAAVAHVMVTTDTPSTYAAKETTATIPIVMWTTFDPVEGRLVANLRRPGGNVTGLADFETLNHKQLELLKEMIPQLGRVAVLLNPAGRQAATHLREYEEAARALRLQLSVVTVRGPDDLGAAFAEIDRARSQAVLLSADAILFRERQLISELAITHKIPAITHRREIAEAGVLMSYGSSRTAVSRRQAAFVDRILRGAKPGDLPVEQPTEVELVVNLKTAKALGLTVPPALIARADEVIE
jgi:putative ABC transport system substrate-binding protein